MKKTKIKKDLSNKIKKIGSGSKIRGITLISLVITIIILLILAGITIAQLSNSGLFNKTQEAKEKWNNAEKDENEIIAKYSNEIDSYVDGNRGTVTLTEEEYQIFKNQTIFSNEEKKIGYWLNNKPIYRFIIKNTTKKSITRSTWDKYYLAEDLNIESLIHAEFGRMDSNGNKLENFSETNISYNSSNKYIEVFLRDNNLQMPNGSYIIIEYTKTTN